MDGGQSEDVGGEAGRREGRVRLTGAEAVGAWLSSGQTLEGYCERTGQSVWSLRRWRREHGERFGLEIQRRPGSGSAVQSGASSTMIPVQVVGGVRPTVASMTIEGRLGRQRSLVIPGELDGATLTRLVTALEAAP